MNEIFNNRPQQVDERDRKYHFSQTMLRGLCGVAGKIEKLVHYFFPKPSHDLPEFTAKEFFKHLLCAGVSIIDSSFAFVGALAFDGHTTLFHQLASRNYLKGVSILLKNGCSMERRDWRGNTPLLAAAEKGHAEIMSLLLQNNADVNAVNEPRLSALHYAARTGVINVINILLEYKGDIDHLSRLYTPLHEAAFEGHADAVQLLLSHKANSNILSFNDDSFLAVAVEARQCHIVEALVKSHPQAVRELSVSSGNYHYTSEKIHFKRSDKMQRMLHGPIPLRVAMEMGCTRCVGAMLSNPLLDIHDLRRLDLMPLLAKALGMLDRPIYLERLLQIGATLDDIFDQPFQQEDLVTCSRIEMTIIDRMNAIGTVSALPADLLRLVSEYDIYMTAHSIQKFTEIAIGAMFKSGELSLTEVNC